MNTDLLCIASATSDEELLSRLAVFAGREREATVELVAHLAALDARPHVYLAAGYGSLHAYCTQYCVCRKTRPRIESPPPGPAGASR